LNLKTVKNREKRENPKKPWKPEKTVKNGQLGRHFERELRYPSLARARPI
jgi:hypothetical protein